MPLCTIFGVPRLPADIVHRPRLHDRLDVETALTLVTGPAGSGKTTLVADWTQSRPEDAPTGVWLTLLSERDVTSDELFLQIVQSFRDAGLIEADVIGPGQGEASTTDPDPSDSGATEIGPAVVGHAVAGRLLRGLAGPHLMIIDNADLLSQEAASALILLLTHCPELRCVILSRGTRFPTFQAQLALETTTIDGDELALTDDEAYRIVGPHLRTVEPITPDVLADTVGRSPIGARAAAVALRRHARRAGTGNGDSPPAMPRNEAIQLIADAFRHLITASARGTDFADFLLTTSIAPELTLELATALSEVSSIEDCAAMLDQAEWSGLGSWRIDTESGTRWFRYIPAVRAALKGDLERMVPERLRRLNRLLGEWARERNLAMVAMQAFIDCGDIDDAELVARDHLDVLLSWAITELPDLLARMPLHQLREHPYLLLPLAVSYSVTDHVPGRAAELYGMAVTAARVAQRKAAPQERFRLQVVEAVAIRMSGAVDEAVPAADRALDTLDDLTLTQRDALSLALPGLLNQLTTVYLRGRQIESARRSLATGYALTGLRLPEHEFEATGLAAAIEALRGDPPSAARIVDRIVRTWPAVPHHDRRGDGLLLAQAVLAAERLDFADARALLASAEELRTSALRVWAAMVNAFALIAQRKPEAAADELARLEAVGPAPGLGTTEREVVAAVRAVAMHSAGQLRRDVVPPAGDAPMVRYLTAMLMLVWGEARDALQMLGGPGARSRTVDGHAGAGLSVSCCWPADPGLLRAAALLRLGREDSAVAQLRESAAGLAATNRVLPMMLVPSSDLAELAKLAERHQLAEPTAVLAARLTVPDILGRTAAPVRLTEREKVVLAALATTGSIAAISRDLGVSPNTVKSQVRSAYRRLGVNSRADALLVANEHGLLDLVTGMPPDWDHSRG